MDESYKGGRGRSTRDKPSRGRVQEHVSKDKITRFRSKDDRTRDERSSGSGSLSFSGSSDDDFEFGLSEEMRTDSEVPNAHEREKRDLNRQFASSLCNRIHTLLPYQTGHSMSEVELNPQFMSSKKVMIGRAKDLKFVNYVLKGCLNILESINEECGYVKLVNRDDRSLASTQIVLHLLTDVIQINWGLDESMLDQSLFGNYHTKTNITNKFVERPGRLSPSIVTEALSTLINIMSPKMVRTAIASLRGNAEELELYEDKKYINNIDDIDNYIEMIFRFIAASTPFTYFSYIKSKFYKYMSKADVIPFSELQKFLPLVNYIFITKHLSLQCISLITNALPHIKSTSWQIIFLIFFASNIQRQTFIRTFDYVEIVESDTSLEQTAKTLFDQVSVLFENSQYSDRSSVVLNWYVIFCLNDFHEFENKPSKLKISFNKRFRYLNSLLKEAHNGENLHCFEALINILHLGARLEEYSHSHPIHVFCIDHVDETYINLKRYMASSNAENDVTLNNLIVSFFSAAIMLKSKKYLNYLFDDLTNIHDGNFDVRVLVKIIRGLSENPRTEKDFLNLMSKFSKTLKNMIFNTVKQLKQGLNPFSSSFSFGVLSDKSSIHSSINVHASRTHTSDTRTTDHLSYSPPLESTDVFSSSGLSSDSKSHNSVKYKLFMSTEEFLTDLFVIFWTEPHLYFNDTELMNENVFNKFSAEELSREIDNFGYEVTMPLRYAFETHVTDESFSLFDAACSLATKLVTKNTLIATDYTTVSTFSNYTVSNYLIQIICQVCLNLSLTNPRFKSSIVFLSNFTSYRKQFHDIIISNEILRVEKGHVRCFATFQELEKTLLLSLCTHDIQFYNISKSLMKWYTKEIKDDWHFRSCFKEHLGDTFERIIEDDSVFTGFVSLHKKFRSILRDAKPTKSLYHVWLIIYSRWLDILEEHSSLNENILVFRHYSGFLVSTAGCFLQESFSVDDPSQKANSRKYVDEFFDKCTSLLASNDLVIRVVIKDTLSNESHSDVYHLICTKLMAIAKDYNAKNMVNEESILYVEHTLVIISSMITIDNEGSFSLVSFLPHSCDFFVKFINSIENETDRLRLKLRFCKLVTTIESDKSRHGVSGAFKFRNESAKTTAEWLEQAVFHEDAEDEQSSNQSVKSSKDQDLSYQYVDLATECSKALAGQLEELILETPDGIRDSDIRKYKDIAFGNYFSLFYKIIQKYISVDTNPEYHKSKYKIHLLIDNVLKGISNILQFDVDVGLQFVLPLGYHENTKIRSLFLKVFSNMLSFRQIQQSKEEFSDQIIDDLTSTYKIYGSVVEIASANEYNLLASSLFACFGYAKRLDKLFQILLTYEINNVQRSSDIFRRNSTLTRLLANFAKGKGIEYLNQTIKPFIEKLVRDKVYFEVEKKVESSEEDGRLFLLYYTELVNVVIHSASIMPKSFKFICKEIYQTVESKFQDAVLIAVGSLVFLRFFCPAIISPETYFGIHIDDPRSKRTLMQLVKIMQNMANGSLGSIRWASLASHTDKLNDLNKQIFQFLEEVSNDSIDEYAFDIETEKPISELRYLHKFLYTHFINIKYQFIINDPFGTTQNLNERIHAVRKLDSCLKELGQPKGLIRLKVSSPPKSSDSGVSGNYSDFMARMAMRSIELNTDVSLVRSSIFHDGTPVVTVDLKYLKHYENDPEFLVYKTLEISSQVWDSKFYLVTDFTEFDFTEEIGRKYLAALTYYPTPFAKNCARAYYFNIPRKACDLIIYVLKQIRLKNRDNSCKVYAYSLANEPQIIQSLCLDSNTVSVTQDAKVSFKNVKQYDFERDTFYPVTIKIGRQWLQINSNEKYPFGGHNIVTTAFYPIEVYNLLDISKCEITRRTGFDDEFSISLSAENQIILRSSERSEILRFLYFTTSRLPRRFNFKEVDGDADVREMLWFARLYNLDFHGLLSSDLEVRSSASALFASLSSYYDIDFGLGMDQSKNIAFPSNPTDFIVSVSRILAKKYPQLSFRVFKAFFDNFDRLPSENRLSSIMYISPWISNVCDYILLENEENGSDRVADLVRSFCRISSVNVEHISFLNDYIWKKLFAETRLISILIDEVVAFAIDRKNISPDWQFIIAVILPSVETCGEIIERLTRCIENTTVGDSEIAAITSQSKIFEMIVLVEISASLFFSSYVFSKMYLADIFFITTILIDNPNLDFGSKLQNLMINTIQSFLKAPGLTKKQSKVIDKTVEYFSSQRARMLFGVTRERSIMSDMSQVYNRASNFGVLCDVLNNFISSLGSSESKAYWRARWCSNAISIAFSSSSLFQSRALLVVGILAKPGINDSTTTRILKTISKGRLNSLENITNTCLSLSRIVNGLQEGSNIPLTMLFPFISLGFLGSSNLYQSVIECVTNIYLKLIKLDKNHLVNFFAQKNVYKPYITELEDKYQFKLSKENFYFCILFIISQGLKLAYIKHSSLECMKRVYSVAHKELVFGGESQEFFTDGCLLLIYLSSDQKQFTDFIQSLSLDDSERKINANNMIPKIVLEPLLTGKEEAKVSLLYAAYIFQAQGIDSGFKLKFLQLHQHIFNVNKELGLLIFHVIKKALDQEIAYSNTNEIFDIVCNIHANVFTDTDYYNETYEEKVNEIMRNKQILVMKSFQLKELRNSASLADDFISQYGSDLINIEEMIHRGASSFVEGEHLED